MPDRDTAFSKARTYTILAMLLLFINIVVEAFSVFRRLDLIMVWFGIKDYIEDASLRMLGSMAQFSIMISLIIGIITIIFESYLIYKFYDNWLDINNEEVPELTAWRMLLRVIGISATLSSFRMIFGSANPFAYLAHMGILAVLGLFFYLGYAALENLAYVISVDRISSSSLYGTYEERPEDSFYYTEDSEDSYYQESTPEGFNGFDVDERYDDLP